VNHYAVNHYAVVITLLFPKVDDALYCSQGGETSWRVKKDWKHISGQTHWSQAQFPPEEVR